MRLCCLRVWASALRWSSAPPVGRRTATWPPPPARSPTAPTRPCSVSARFSPKDGVKQAYLQVDTAFMYEASGRVDLRGHLKVDLLLRPRGAPSRSSPGRRAPYSRATNEMSARNDVLVVRTADQARLRTDYLQFDPARNEVRTTGPYVADKGAQHFEGVGFVCDPGFTNCTTQHCQGQRGSPRDAGAIGMRSIVWLRALPSAPPPRWRSSAGVFDVRRADRLEPAQPLRAKPRRG